MAKFETEHSNSSRFLSEIERIKNLSNNFLIVDTTKVFNLVSNKPIDLLINYEKTNNIKKINKFHETVNQILPLKGIYISCVESSDQRKARKSSKYIFLFSPILLFTDFIYKRVVPKLPIIKQIYFALTEGKNRVMSEAEILGRLISCGFEVLEYFEYKNLMYVISKKTQTPAFNMQASYGIKYLGLNQKILFNPM